MICLPCVNNIKPNISLMALNHVVKGDGKCYLFVIFNSDCYTRYNTAG
uniref:Uncharacterized protein n=1 Tax=uncultured bacterium contig00034 TaxID=1181523 RepID=A0A806KNK5_9BACT|nr:hypothetical protein [uncultured bacterium contig00034]